MLQILRKILLVILLFICNTALISQEAASPVYSLRIDYHYGSVNPWLFYETPIGKNIGLQSVFQMSTLGFAQVDIGPNFHIKQLQLIPQIGFEFSESSDRGTRLSHFVSEFYAIYYDSKISFESWNLYFAKSVYDQLSFFYHRDFLLYRLFKGISVGPQVEGYAYSDHSSKTYLGGQLNVDIGIGSIGLFMGQDRKNYDNVFRMTFLRNF
jgi:hypothetical protein